MNTQIHRSKKNTILWNTIYFKEWWSLSVDSSPLL